MFKGQVRHHRPAHPDGGSATTAAGLRVRFAAAGGSRLAAVAACLKLLLSLAAFTGIAGSATGTLGTNLFWSGAGVTSAHDADDRLVYDTTTGTLYYDPDGLGGAAAIALATFGTAKPILTAGDFILAA